MSEDSTGLTWVEVGREEGRVSWAADGRERAGSAADSNSCRAAPLGVGDALFDDLGVTESSSAMRRGQRLGIWGCGSQGCTVNGKRATYARAGTA